MILLNDKKINITNFPDKTTQVWKLEDYDNLDGGVIEWRYENDAEIFQLCQLLILLEYGDPLNFKKYELFIPYMPYARQDKEISNESTFAIHVLMRLLAEHSTLIDIKTIDVHSCVTKDSYRANVDFIMRNVSNYNFEFKNIYPNKLIQIVNTHDAIIFPDKGAKDRYQHLFDINIPKYSMSKTRDQLTGKILNMYFNETDVRIKNKKVVIVDDICDGGRTFVIAAKSINDLFFTINGPEQLNLCVTHGIFSSNVLLNEMLNDIFNKVVTTNSLYRDFKDRFDWQDAAKQSVKYNFLHKGLIEGRLQMVDCKEGVELEL